MSAEHVTCVTVTCDDCKEAASIYEDMGVAHYPTVEDAHKELVEERADEPEYQWSTSGEIWLCPSCTATKACVDAGGHDWAAWETYGPNLFRACRRGHCQQSERRPAPTGESA